MRAQKVFIPFRDRGIDLRRGANLEVVQAWWYAHGYEPVIVDDGLEGDAQFNRHRAYNRAINAHPDEGVYVFTEADMLIHPAQIRTAVLSAGAYPGLVVPFTQYRYLSDDKTAWLRNEFHDLPTDLLAEWWGFDAVAPASVFGIKPESVMDNSTSTGAVNVVSRETLDITGGYTELTSGNWYDDRVIEVGFEFMTGRKARHVDGPAVHLYHLPGHSGDHLTDADRAATAHNKEVLSRLKSYIRHNDREAVKSLLSWRRRWA